MKGRSRVVVHVCCIQVISPLRIQVCFTALLISTQCGILEFLSFTACYVRNAAYLYSCFPTCSGRRATGATPIPRASSTFGLGRPGGRFGGEGRIRATWGWISVDRGSKATLPLTMPRRVFKSSAKDSARRPWGIDIQGGRPRLVRRGGLADGMGPSERMLLLWVGRDGGRWRRLPAWILT